MVDLGPQLLHGIAIPVLVVLFIGLRAIGGLILCISFWNPSENANIFFSKEPTSDLLGRTRPLLIAWRATTLALTLTPAALTTTMVELAVGRQDPLLARSSLFFNWSTNLILQSSYFQTIAIEAICAVTLVALRRRSPDIRALFFMTAGLMFATSTVLLIVLLNSSVSDPTNLIATTIACTLSSLVLFYVTRRVKNPTTMDQP